jgi:hypothetical protein
MSVSAMPIALEHAGQVLLLWTDTRDFASRKEFVDLLETHRDEAVIRSASTIRENTQVYLMGKQYTGNGIVSSCRQDDSSFILTIQIDDNSLFRHSSELDPGIFAVEDFLTEQQEAEILRDWETTYDLRDLGK